MIRNLADFIRMLQEEEKKKLSEYKLTHPPTIGAMYEGLSADLLKKSLSGDLGLDFVSGFIHNGKDLTREIDCMMVRGQGEAIPYTAKFKWHVKDVIAVFEIKKELYTSDMVDSFELLRGVIESYGSYITSCSDKEKFRIDSVVRMFETVTGEKFPGSNFIKELSPEKELLFHTFILELISPIRVVIGYDGFKDEYAFRKALCDFLVKNTGKLGFGPTSFPQLMISGNYSLIKLNGQPYMGRRGDNRWCFYASARSNPILMLLELLWTRLSRLGILQVELWGEDLIKQNFIQLLLAEPEITEKKMGWKCTIIPVQSEEFKEAPAETDWSPYYVTLTQFSILGQLCNGKVVQVDDIGLLNYLSSKNEQIQDVLDPLFEIGLVVLSGKEIKLTTDMLTCAILPNGKYAVAENNSGRFTDWLAKNFKSRE